MKTQIIVLRGTVKAVEQKINRMWSGGIGKDAKFYEHSEGWFITLAEWPVSIYVGPDKPTYLPGKSIKIILDEEVQSEKR